MYKLVGFALVVAVVAADLETQWAVFKAKHGKTYSTEMDAVRKNIWKDNLDHINRHNKLYVEGLSTYYLGENEFCDMTHNEFRSVMLGMSINKRYTLKEVSKVNDSLPSSVDWRKKGAVSKVKNQKQCGSCWAFSTTGSVEGQHFLKTGDMVLLSESNLIDCSRKYGNNGCEGGLMDNAFTYIIDNGGIDTEQSYPYDPQDDPCNFSRKNIGAKISGFKDIPSGSENALKEATAKVGPISVAIDASHRSFQLYRGGVYNEPECSSKKLDHGVLAVGYGTDDGNDYWLVKNSWGPTWGKEGYIKMSRNRDNQCGIATQASYPIV